MQKYTMKVGSYYADRSGRPHDDYQEVAFEADKVGEAAYLTGSDDTRGVDQVLFKTPDGKLLVYEYYWTKWQGETSSRGLLEVEEGDLGPNGQYWRLGKGAGYGRPLTLEEALKA